MSSGIQTFGSSGQLLFDSTLWSTKYPSTVGSYTSSTSLPADLYTDNRLWATTYGSQFSFSAPGDGAFYFNLVGDVINNTYTSPSKVKTDTSTSTGISVGGTVVNSAPALVMSIGDRNTTGSTYGLQVFGGNGKVAVSSDTPMYVYVKNTATGGITFTASITSLVSSTESNINPQSSYSSNRTSTIIFPEAFNYPPLIIIRDTGGVYISLIGFNIDAAGKYVGAVVVAESAWGLKNSYFGYGFNTATTGTVTYSLGIPYAVSSSAYGCLCYNADGSTVFVSDVQPINFSTNLIPKPYVRSWYSGGSYGIDRVNTYNTEALPGVVLNNILGCTGSMYSVASVVGYWYLGTLNFTGRFIKVGASGVTVIGSGACSVFAQALVMTGSSGGWGTYSFDSSTAATLTLITTN